MGILIATDFKHISRIFLLNLYTSSFVAKWRILSELTPTYIQLFDRFFNSETHGLEGGAFVRVIAKRLLKTLPTRAPTILFCTDFRVFDLIEKDTTTGPSIGVSGKGLSVRER